MLFRHFCFFWGCLLVLAGADFAALATPATAGEAEWQANWRFEVDFVGDRPNVTLTVFVWEIVDGVPQPLTPETHDLDCWVAPGVTLAGNAATFSGKGGILCAVPSIQQIVSKMTEEQYELPDECMCKTGASAFATLAFTPNGSESDFGNPIFHLTDLEWSVPIAAGGGLRPFMRMSVDTVMVQSTRFAGAGGNIPLQGIFEANQIDEEEYEYVPLFKANAVALGVAPALIQQNLHVSNQQPVLYIGYSPTTKQSLHGTLTTLVIDPGCFGNGGQ